jgi:hypothetical protein
MQERGSHLRCPARSLGRSLPKKGDSQSRSVAHIEHLKRLQPGEAGPVRRARSTIVTRLEETRRQLPLSFSSVIEKSRQPMKIAQSPHGQAAAIAAR